MEKRYVLSWVLMVFIMIACGNADTSVAQQGYEQLNSDKFYQLLEENDLVQLIDVRTPEEVSFGMIKGARHFDIYNPDFAKRLEKLDKDKPVAVYCAVGGRSAKAGEKLIEMGFVKVYNLEGGMRSWQVAGYPVE